MLSADNTAEAIVDFAYAERVSGDTSHRASASAAFDWLAAYPSYEQNTLYVGAYVCGWVVRAVVEYEATTKDASRHAFGAMCVQELEVNGPSLAASTATMDVAAAAWGASAMWIWGDAYADDAAHTSAEQVGAAVKAWIEQDPSTNLVARDWAFTGGAAFYGVMGSYMKAHPGEAANWADQYAPMLGGWIDESTPWTDLGPDWRNAFNAWNMAAQFAAARALGANGAAHEAIARDILSKLVAQEQQGTCAIPGSAQLPATQAQSWLTSYLLYFGLREVIEEESTPPASSSGCNCNVASARTSAPGVITLFAFFFARRRRRCVVRPRHGQDGGEGRRSVPRPSRARAKR
jgi:MYXO-CTERM domain-containing protein